MAEPIGRLVLVPAPLDFGLPEAQWVDLQAVLPLQVLQVAAGLEHWIVENAKTARAFLKRVDRLVPLARPLQQVQIVELPRPQKGRSSSPTADVAAKLLAPVHAGHTVGLMSEAGLPALADPGADVVRAAHASGVPVQVLAGPSSLALAVSASGLNGQSFAFVGYLPVEAGERSRTVRELEAHSRRWRQTQLMIETPYRNGALLEALIRDLAPTTRLSVSCSLTLPDAWTRTDTVQGWRRGAEPLPADRPAVFAFLAS